MRRLLSISLLLVICLPLFAPLLAWGQGSDAGLPACCRRNGAHHCAMNMAERDGMAAAESKSPHWIAPAEHCPYCPALVAAWHHVDIFAAPSAQAIFAELVSHPSGSAQTESRRRIARDRSRQKRGPPASHLA